MNIFGQPKQSIPPVSNRLSYLSGNPITHSHSIQNLTTVNQPTHYQQPFQAYTQAIDDPNHGQQNGINRRQEVIMSRRNERPHYDHLNMNAPQNVDNSFHMQYAQQKANGHNFSNLQAYSKAANGNSNQNNSIIPSNNNTQFTDAQPINSGRNLRNLNKSHLIHDNVNNSIIQNHNNDQQQRVQSRGISLDNQYSNLQSHNVGYVQSQQQLKRHLPINTKEKIFNEWGAVLRHQDEIDDQKRKDDFEKERIRQQMYKNELDSQLAMHQNKIVQSKIDDRTIDYSLLEYQKKIDQEKNLMENMKRDLLKKMINDKVQSSLQEKERIQIEMKQNLKSEQEQHRDQILYQQQEEKQNQMRQKMDKQVVANLYSNELYQQEQMKKMQKVEENRQHYFEGLRRYQELNDIKHKQLSNYLKDDIHSLAQKDEAAYIKAVQEKEERDRRKEDDDARKQLRTKNMNKSSLMHQMHERDVSQKMKVIEDRQFAEQVKSNVFTEQQKEQMRQDEAKIKQKQYLDGLQSQITEAKVRRKYDSLMTEHERRVNDRDIQAYEDRDTSNLYSKVPGINSNEQQLKDKYMQKMFQNQMNHMVQGSPSGVSQNQQRQQQYISPMSSPRQQYQASVSNTTNNAQEGLSHQGSSYTLNNNLNVTPIRGSKGGFSQNNRSQLQLGAQNQLQNINRSVDQYTIEEARKNMEVPEALRYRHNTNNRAYGFEQTLNKSVPRQAVDQGNNMIQYNFAVAGNYKM